MEPDVINCSIMQEMYAAADEALCRELEAFRRDMEARGSDDLFQTIRYKGTPKDMRPNDAFWASVAGQFGLSCKRDE